MADATETDRLHATELRLFAQMVRTELWAALGLNSPLAEAELWPWVHARWYEQRLEGDRFSLHMPRLPPGILPPYSAVFPPTRPGPAGTQVTFLTQGYRAGVQMLVSAFAGVYLEDDLALWPAEGRWRFGMPVGSIQPLALVALAATSVQEVTGGTPEQAALFLLCDQWFGTPGIRIKVGFGVHIWSPSRLLTVEELGRQYADARQRRGLGRRAKGPEKHTGELIEHVRHLRPHKGRHPENAAWAAVLTRWNDAHPAHTYSNERSIATAYNNARNVRTRKGLLYDGERVDFTAEGERSDG